MVSQLERAIISHRNAIRSIDRAALANVYLAYQDVMERINPQIELLQQALRDKGELTASQVLRLERYQELQRQIAAEMDTLARKTRDITHEAQERAVRTSIGHAEQVATASAASRSGRATIASAWVNVPEQAVEDFIGATREGPLRNLIDSFGETTSNTLFDELVNGIAQGTNPRAVANSITKAMDIGRNRALTIARTEMLRASRGATLVAYNNNADILDGWIWTAAHQARTCAACLAMDGSFHELTETMPSHPNCRCAMRPQLGGEPMRKVPTGEDWIGRQSPEVQDQILGKAGGEAFRAGEVELDDFIHFNESKDWGKSVTDGGIGRARANAAKRGQPIKQKPPVVKAKPATQPRPRTKSKPEASVKQRHPLAGTAPDTVLSKEDQIRANATESAHVYSERGVLKFSKEGTAELVSFTHDELGQLKNATLTHNHPSGGITSGRGFSDGDLLVAVNSDLREMRAVTSDGTRFVLTRPSGGWGATADQVNLAYQEETAAVMKDYRARYLAGNLTHEEAGKQVQVDIGNRIAQRFDWEIREERI